MDTHQIEEAFEDLMSELQKVKNINESAEEYKSHVSKLTDQLELFYKSAKENNIRIKTIADDACLKLSESAEIINSSANSLAQIEKNIKTTEANIFKSNLELGNTLMKNIDFLSRKIDGQNDQLKRYKILNFILLIVILVFLVISYIY